MWVCGHFMLKCILRHSIQSRHSQNVLDNAGNHSLRKNNYRGLVIADEKATVS